MNIQHELSSKDKAMEQLIDLRAYVSVMTLRHLGQDATLTINHHTQDDIMAVVNHDLPIILDVLSGRLDGALPKSSGAHEEFGAEYTAFMRETVAVKNEAGGYDSEPTGPWATQDDYV